MIDPNNYLAFVDITLYEIIGDLMLFGLIGFIVLVVYAGHKQMPFQVVVLLSLIYWAVFCGIYFDQMVWTFVVLIFSGLSYYIYSKMLRRG